MIYLLFITVFIANVLLYSHTIIINKTLLQRSHFTPSPLPPPLHPPLHSSFSASSSLLLFFCTPSPLYSSSLLLLFTLPLFFTSHLHSSSSFFLLLIFIHPLFCIPTLHFSSSLINSSSSTPSLALSPNSLLLLLSDCGYKHT